VRGEKAVCHDFMVRLRRRRLAERTQDIDRDVIAPRYPTIEIHCVEEWRLAWLDIAFLAQFALQRLKERFALLDAPSRQMPTRHIGVLDKEDPAFPVKDEAANPKREPARKSPIGVKNPPHKRLEVTADATQRHVATQAGIPN